MSLEKRIERLEAIIGEVKVSWRLKDGTPVEVYSDELEDCFCSILQSSRENLYPTHSLIEKVKEADTTSYTGDDSLLGLIQSLLSSRQDSF